MRRLGRLPRLAPLTAETLAAAFAAAFRHDDFELMTEKPHAVWHPFTQHALEPAMTKIARSEGAYLYTEDGRRLIDAISSWWVVTHGHRHPAIMRAIRDETEKLDQIIFAGYTHAPAEELAKGLLALAPRGPARMSSFPTAARRASKSR